MFLIIVVGFFSTGAGFMGYYMFNRRWPFIATLCEERPPFGTIIVARDRARYVSLTDTGEEIYFLRNAKKFRLSHGKFIGTKAIMWVKSKRDGYWYNCSLGNVDKKLLELGVIPTSRTARLEQAAMRKNITGRFENEKDFMEKWGQTIGIGLILITIIIAGISQYMLYDKAAETKSVDLETAKLNKEVLDRLDRILDKTQPQPDGSDSSGLIPIA